MRFKEILNLNERGLRMGYKDLHATPIDQMTIGFEFEIIVNSRYIEDEDGDEEEDDDIDSLVDEFYNQWEGYSEDDFISDSYSRRYSKVIDEFGGKPRYGWVPLYDIELENYKEKIKTNEELYNRCKQILNMPENTEDEKIEKLYYMAKERHPTMSDDQISNAIHNQIDSLDTYLTNYKEYLTPPTPPNEEDFEDEYSDEIFYIDPEDNDGEERRTMEVDDIDDLETFKEYFDYDNRSFVRQYERQEEYASSSAMDEFINSSRRYRTKKGSAVGYLYRVFNNHFRNESFIRSAEYHSATRRSAWIVEPDTSVSGGAEVISPPMPMKKGIEILKEVFKLINDDPALSTDKSTGLHINIGTWPNGEGLDLLKLILFVGDTHVLKTFKREFNTYTKPLYDFLMDKILDKKNIQHQPDISELNRKIKLLGDKYRTINFGHLSEGYLEFRASGGIDYHLKTDEVINTILRYARALNIASNPEAYKKEYASKLYTLIDNSDTLNTEEDKPEWFFNLKYIGLTEQQINIFNSFIKKCSTITIQELGNNLTDDDYFNQLIIDIWHIDDIKIKILPPEIVIILRKFFLYFSKTNKLSFNQLKNADNAIRKQVLKIVQ